MKTKEQIVTELKENIKFRIDVYSEITIFEPYTIALIDTLKFIIGKKETKDFVNSIIVK